MLKTVKKRSGEIVEFCPDKINKWAEWAAGIGVDWASVSLEACRKVFDGCSTEDLHQALIQACVDKETLPYSKMAGRLYIGDLYKRVFGHCMTKPTVKQMYHNMVGKGMWEDMDYSDDELDALESVINHSKDMDAPIFESKQITDKYAIVDRVAKRPYETPQFVYMRMAMGNMQAMPKHRRMEDVKNLYEMLSNKEINAPTPFSINLGTPKRHYASCCVFTTDDTAASLAAGDHIAYMMTCASAGIGGFLKTRSKGDKVRGGAIIHQGKLPYLRVQEKVVQANLQSSRGGAATHYVCPLDPEIEKLLALKNVQTIQEDRIKDIDYGMAYNSLLANKVAKGEKWMLVSYADAPDLWELFYSDKVEDFEKEYNRVESDESIKKTWVAARSIVSKWLSEWSGTGRYYGFNAYEANHHTPFKDTIYSSNLCNEIALPTIGYSNVFELNGQTSEGEIGLCSLAAINANVSEERYPLVAYYACLMIDNVIEIMDYPFRHLAHTAKNRRSIGVGITNLAFALAKRGLTYSSGKQWVFDLADRHSFWLHKASVKLAQERDKCGWYALTKYSDGWLPVDTENKHAAALVEPSKLDWEGLRKEIAEHGCRFSVLEAHMPTESSSVASGHTNGLYPIRDKVVVKTSGTNKTVFIAPESDTLHYQTAWEVPTKDLTDIYALVQTRTGQGISADYYQSTYNGEVSMKTMLQDWLYRVKMGLKGHYYMNSRTMKPDDQEDCEACKL